MEDEGDRISALPGHVREHILSFLETKDAITTSLLSKTWRYDWLSVSCVDLGEEFFLEGNKMNKVNIDDRSLKYVEFITRALINNIDKVPTIRKIVLYLPARENLNEKISSCLENLKNVQELSCQINTAYWQPSGDAIPKCVLTTPNITRLDAACCRLPSTISRLNLPNLRKLFLEEVDIGQGMLESIIAKCTSLQTLNLHFCTGFNSLRISGLPALKNLYVFSESRLTTTEIDAPNLEELIYELADDGMALIKLVSTAKSLRYLKVHYYEAISHRDWVNSNIPAHLSHIKELVLYGWYVLDHIARARIQMDCLESLTIGSHGPPSPEQGQIKLESLCVKNLKHLKLDYSEDATDDWINQQIAQLTKLESLMIEDCDNVVHLIIRHMRLTTLGLRGLEKLERVDIDCPNLRTFSYYVASRENIMSLTASSELTALTSCELHHKCLTNGNDKLHQLLENLKYSKYMTLHIRGENLKDIGSWRYMKDSLDRPPLSETKINLEVSVVASTTNVTISKQQVDNILGSLLWLCPQPQLIRLRRQLPIKACCTATFEYKDETELDSVEGCGCYKSYSGRCWDHSYKSFNIKMEPGFKTGELNDVLNSKRKSDVLYSLSSMKRIKH